MKKLTFFMLGLVIVACSPATRETPVMTGAYKMLSQTISSETAVDSAEAKSNEMKIYTPDFVMWAKVVAMDSTPAFGMGSYSPSPGGLTESLIYRVSDTVVVDNTLTFKLEIEKTTGGFRQVIPSAENSGKKFTSLKEEYQSVGIAAVSPLDGAWQQTQRYLIRGKDTTFYQGTQFKIFQSGYTMFGFTFLDSFDKRVIGVGYGTFEMAGTKSKETMLASNFGFMVGQTFDIDIELLGTDGYKQTIAGENGLDVEVYERLKKPTGQ